VLFVEGVVEVVLSCQFVYFLCELAYFGALLLEGRRPPSLLIWGWFGEGYVFVDDAVECVLEVLERCFEFVGAAEDMRDGELVEFSLQIFGEVFPHYLSPVVPRGRGGTGEGDVEGGDDGKVISADGAFRGEDVAFDDGFTERITDPYIVGSSVIF